MEKREVRVTNIKVTSLAMFEGVLAAIVGFIIAVAAWLGLTFNYVAATDSLLRGLLWGLAPGLLAVIVDTVIYFAIGWLIGAVHGLLFNAATSWMGGIVVEREEERYREAASAPRMASSRRAEPSFGETIRRRDVDE
jgi:hypothetical protein